MYEVKRMVDQLHGNSDEQNGDDEGGDPEVPPRSAPDHGDTEQAAEEKQCGDPESNKYFKWFRETACPWVARTAGNSNVWMALATVVIAFSTVAYTFYASQQWTVMTNTLEEQKQEFNRNSRPWVGLSGKVRLKNPVGVVPEKMGFELNGTLKNFGQSPALFVFEYANIVWNPFEIKEAQKLVCQGAEMTESGNYSQNISSLPGFGAPVFPQSNFPLIIGFGSGGNTVIADRHFLRMYIAGCIVYRDQDNGIHHTKWCVQSPTIETADQLKRFLKDGNFIPCFGNQFAD
jgi:hypothetical protein